MREKLAIHVYARRGRYSAVAGFVIGAVVANEFFVIKEAFRK